MMTAMVEPAGRATDLEGSFYALYRRDCGLVLRYFRAAVVDSGIAEDLSADTFCRAWDRWSGFRGDDDMARAWGMRVARHPLIAHARRNKKEAFWPPGGSPAGEDMEAPAAGREGGGWGGTGPGGLCGWGRWGCPPQRPPRSPPSWSSATPASPAR